jgi:DNA-binding transcriptional MerR regulator
MFSIGEFARHGRVSVRMLRHYDTIGLLQPACVDPVTGYRFYQAGQLADLNRLIALKELGFSLQQVQSILGDQLSAAELRGMLRLRRAEIRAQIDAQTTRLARVATSARCAPCTPGCSGSKTGYGSPTTDVPACEQAPRNAPTPPARPASRDLHGAPRRDSALPAAADAARPCRSGLPVLARGIDTTRTAARRAPRR